MTLSEFSQAGCLASCCFLPSIRNSVLSSFSIRLSDIIQLLKSLMQSVRLYSSIRLWRLRRRHYPKVTNFVSPLHALFLLRGLKAGSPEQVRWAHLARSGNQSEHTIRFVLPARVANQNIRFRFILLVGAASSISQLYNELNHRAIFYFYRSIKCDMSSIGHSRKQFFQSS